MPEMPYIEQLLCQFKASQDFIEGRALHSVFIGGGTPSLISPSAIDHLLNQIDRHWGIPKGCEITLEANPGTTDNANIQGFHQAGVNRLSIGIQSFEPKHLKKLGRIHSENDAYHAVEAAHRAGFKHINIDLMFALPDQTLHEAISDLENGIQCEPDHISWYQLTIEPQTAFYHKPPPLPDDEVVWLMYEKGQSHLATHGFKPYEVSAYSKGYRCTHNVNYWRYGDYLGLGAGAHSKITLTDGHIMRFSQSRSPKSYLLATSFNDHMEHPKPEQIRMEYMMNHLRLNEPLSLVHFEERTGLSKHTLDEGIQQATQNAWMNTCDQHIKLTPQGRQYLNDCILLF